MALGGLVRAQRIDFCALQQVPTLSHQRQTEEKKRSVTADAQVKAPAIACVRSNAMWSFDGKPGTNDSRRAPLTSLRRTSKRTALHPRSSRPLPRRYGGPTKAPCFTTYAVKVVAPPKHRVEGMMMHIDLDGGAAHRQFGESTNLRNLQHAERLHKTARREPEAGLPQAKQPQNWVFDPPTSTSSNSSGGASKFSAMASLMASVFSSSFALGSSISLRA